MPNTSTMMIRAATTALPTATVIMIEPVCCTCEVPRNCGCVVRAIFATEVFGAGIYSSVIFCGSMVLRNAVVGMLLCWSCVYAPWLGPFVALRLPCIVVSVLVEGLPLSL
jgi:hypothetical protein